MQDTDLPFQCFLLRVQLDRVRSRALAGFLTQFAAIFGTLLLNLFLDRAAISRRTRAKIGFGVPTVFGIATWIWALVLQAKYFGKTPVRKQLSVLGRELFLPHENRIWTG
ncbi:hypothetical protein RQP46_006898 [Phenoliferia psychrophenolica]